MKISSMQSLFCLLSAALFAFVSVAGEEMVVNGDFEEGYASDQSWGAYSDKDAYSNPGWSVTASGGLAKPDGTWMNNGLDVGGYALFLQSSTSSSATAYQEVSITEPGTYRISFRWAARPGHVGQSVRVIFDSTTLDTISTTDTSLQYWYKDVEINAAGSFSLYLVSEVASGDVATVFDSVSMRRIKKYTWTGGGQTSSVSDAGNWGGRPGSTQQFNSTDYIIFDKAADVVIDSDVMVDGILITGRGAVSFSGSRTITIERGIISDSSADAEFNCPVKFLGTYMVFKNQSVKFSGGVTATYPDVTLRTVDGNEQSRTLEGDITFTEDWEVALCGSDADRPWIVPAGSTVHGRSLTGRQNSHRSIIKLCEGASAYFTSVINGWDIGDIDIDGYMEVSGEMIVQTYNSSSSNESHFGRNGNTGTLKAYRIAKIGHSIAGSYIPNLIVGAGGTGSMVQDYYWRFMVNTTITAAENFEFLGVYKADTQNFTDWGIDIGGRTTLTINVPEGITVTCGIGVSGGEGALRKTGAGTLVMSNTYDGKSIYAKNYGSAAGLAAGTIVDEGTMRLVASGQIGSGAVRLAEGARLEIASGVSVANRIDGNGTIQFANGVTLANNGNPSRAESVEFTAASDRVTLTAADGASAPLVFLTGVNAADLSHFTYAAGTLSVKGGALMLADVAAAGTYVWNGGANGDWSIPGNWLVDGVASTAAPGAANTVRFENDVPVTVGGTDALTVTKIITTTGATVTFDCPVAFNGTYNVQNAAVAPDFAGGATATYPDGSLTSANIPSHEFRGNITFTEDWTIPSQSAGNPFVFASGAKVYGKTIAADAYQNANYHLRIDKDAVATFDTVSVAGKLVFKLNGGKLIANGDVNMGGDATGRDCGQYLGNIGTVEAKGIIKNVAGVGLIYFYLTDMIVGSDGFGMYRKDYNIQFGLDSKLTATANLTIHQPIAEDGPKDGDWGLNLNGKTFTIDTAGYTVTFDSWVSATAAKIVKEGEGEMIMQSRQKQHTGGTILNGGLTTVKTVGSLGYGLTTVNPGAVLRFTDSALTQDYPIEVKSGATLENTIPVALNAKLTLEAGSTLIPQQNTYFSVTGGVALPGSGTVYVDLSNFACVNGISNPLLSGVAAGDEDKFTLILPEGIFGDLSVDDGTLYFTTSSGGTAAADLFWHPVGDSTWSVNVAAWTNAVGNQVAFTPYSNATIADPATISLPADVSVNDVTVSSDGDVILNGTGKLGGTGTIVKTGEGTFTFNTTGGLDSQPIIVSNGVFKIGEALHDNALGSAADTSPLVIENGATLDINFNAEGIPFHTNRNMVTRNKLITVSGDGHDGNGAIVNNTFNGYDTISQLVLDDDASVGGKARFDVRGNKAAAIGYARNGGSIYGPDKRLTVKNTSTFGIVYSDVTLGSLYIVDGGKVQIEGTGTYNIADGIHLVDGHINFYGAGFGNVPISADSGANTFAVGSGTPTVSNPITVADGATLTHTGGSAIYSGAMSGPLRMTGGTAYFTSGIPADGWVLDGQKSGEIVKLRQSGTFNGANITCTTLGMGDVANATLDIVFKNSNIDVVNFMVGWGLGTATALASANISVGEGTTVTTPKVAIGDDGTTISNNVKTVLSVDGGTLNLTNNDFFVAYNGPNAEFVVNSGTANVDKATIWLRRNNQSLGGYNKARFIQNGGVFNYGGAGFQAHYEDNNDGGQIIFGGGEFNALANWAIPHFIPLYFKDGIAGGWTLNQADGLTATWDTALSGNGDVTLNGNAALVGNKEVQGAVGGKWTVGDGFTAGLQGAASFLGGLSLGEGAVATIDVATDRSAVFTARDFGDRDINAANSLAGRFNKKIGGTTRGTITHNETHLFTHYDTAKRPFGDMNYTAAYAVGQFYVEADAAGTWSFSGKCDDRVALWIDGELVMITTGDCAAGEGSKTLTAGWHSFRHIATDNTGGFGADSGNAYQTIGYKDGSGRMGTFARFNVENLKMRPAADMADPNNTNTIRWSHYKGSSATVTASTYKNDEFAWDFCCITNNLKYLQWYGSNDTTWFNTYTVNRYDGWFFVTAENADKEWTFRSNYDDRAALWIDGVDSGLDGNSGSTLTYKVTLAYGWHHFRIQTADFTGNAGPWSGNGLSVSYQVAGGEQTLFGTDTLAMSVCPDGFMQGNVTLASNSRLTNGATKNAAEVYGTFEATGTGAIVSGPFKFEGAKLAYSNVAANTKDFTSLLKFENAAEDMFANLGGIEVDFAADPAIGTAVIGPAYGLAAEDIESNASVTVNGEPYTKKYTVTVEDNKIKLYFSRGLVFILL